MNIKVAHSTEFSRSTVSEQSKWLLHFKHRNLARRLTATLLAIGAGFVSTSTLALDLIDLDGSNGFRINGIDQGDFSGCSVSGAGDVNGDGIDDVIIGARFAYLDDLTWVGESYVVFGGSDGFPTSFDLASLDGTNGFQLNGVNAYDVTGLSVSGAGDVNGDGIDDVIIGAPGSEQYSQGQSYVVFGSSAGFPASIDLTALNGSNGFQINGSDFSGYSGVSVSGAGDVNGDGIDDLIIGASEAYTDILYEDGWYQYIRPGESYVVYGSSAGFPAKFDLASLNGTNGFQINGIDDGDGSGISVSGAGDVNGDGIDDLIIGASGADPDGQSAAGESYVIFGSSTGFLASFELASLDGTNGFHINGIDEYDRSGHSVSEAGDVNGDGIDDLIIGAPWAGPDGQDYPGESYVVFGSSAGYPASIDLASLNGSNGFQINAIDERDGLGGSVSGVGDVNADGIDDLIIGASWADPNGLSEAGESYVVFGSSAGFPASFNLTALDGSNGFQINGIDANDKSGMSVSGAGDIDGDGIADLIIGAGSAYPAGESYVLFGQPTPSIEDEIKEEIEELIEEVEEIAPALAEPLERALIFLTDNSPKNDPSACGQLELFSRKVITLERSGGLTEEQAEELLEDAEEISEDLGCS